LAKVKGINIMLNKGIITIAVGKKYAKQAKYLALSCMVHAPHIPRAVITDCGAYLKPFFDIIIDYKEDLGAPFETKTLIHLYTPFEKNLFLDADSLVFNNIDYYFYFLDKSFFLYYGMLRYNGHWYYDIEKTKNEHSVEWIPEFNSGMLLFYKNKDSTELFKTANDYMKNPTALNVGYFRKNMYPDEPFFALAFAKKGIKPFDDCGRFSRTLIGAEDITINVVKGYARFKKFGSFVFPSVVHFCGKLGSRFYFIEKVRLFFYTSSFFYRQYGKLLVLIRDIFKKK
jgi:hypothetical protein